MIQFTKPVPDNTVMYKYNQSVKPKAKHKADVHTNWTAFAIVTIIYAVWHLV